ncbi:MAG TPA: DUF6036 family nucleotidyltransferase [bacterium]|nr:DUF6036 family nucleotidyltransferase [bacterium]
MYDLFKELKTVAEKLEAEGFPYALCGGLAVGVYGESRGTIDIDLVVEQKDIDNIISSLLKIGFENFSTPMPLGKGQMPIQRLIKFGKGESEVLMLDLCMPDRNQFQEVWKNWQKLPYGDMKIWVLSVRGLIEMKKSRGSAKDLSDIEALEKKLP